MLTYYFISSTYLLIIQQHRGVQQNYTNRLNNKSQKWDIIMVEGEFRSLTA